MEIKGRSAAEAHSDGSYWQLLLLEDLSLHLSSSVSSVVKNCLSADNAPYNQLAH
jgi:hypothetical protein